ncbi:MAG: PAS domain S-box protein [Syntrophales bacterium]
MQDQSRINQKLIEEIAVLKQRIQELEKLQEERKQAEEALQERERHMKLALEGTDQGLWEWDILSRKVVYDDNWPRIMNLPSEGRHVDMDQWLASLDAEGRAAFEINMTDYLAGRVRYYEIEHRLLTENKEWKWIWTRGIATERDPLGIPLRMIGTYRDITKRKRAEEALRESENRLREITTKIPGVVYQFYVKPNGAMGFYYVSDMSEHVLGLKSDLEGYFERFSAIVIPEHRDGFIKSIEKSVKEASEWKYEGMLQKPSGEIIWFSGNSTPSLRENEIVFNGIVRDITDRKKAEDTLKLSEVTYREIFNTVNDAIWVHDIETGEFLDVNNAVTEIFGYSVSEALNLNVEDISSGVHPFIKETAMKLFRAAADGQPQHFEWQCKHKDGHFFWTEVNLKRASIAGKECVLAIERDITDRKRAEEALSKSEERLTEAQKMTHLGFWYWDVKTGDVEWSEEVFKIFHLDPKEFTPHIDSIMALSPWPEDHQRNQELINRAIETHAQGFYEQKFLRPDQSIGHYYSTFQGHYDENGDLLSIFGTVLDITERKRAEEENLVLKERLQHADKMEAIGTLAGGIAHDFNNLLMGIQGYASLSLMNLDPSHPNYERLKRIEDQVQSGADLTRQLLGFARGGRYDVKPADMNDILEKSSSMFGRTKKEISIHRKYGKDLWIVEVDRGQMEQVFMNLYVNAWQAMPGGGEIYLETENIVLDDEQALSHAVKPGQYVKISMTDTGTGMDAKTRERIFDPFFTTKEMGRGTGLGLATVYGIIKGHGGSINAYSEPGHGTTFTIYLPASEKEVAKEQTATGAIARGTETILLVDDEKMILEVSKELLEAMGYLVYAVGSGQKAVAVYMEKRNEIDLVILDMIMPGISGGETFDRLQEINPAVKVLLSSGYSITGQAQEILDRGCNGFLQKPFHPEILSSKVREMLA